MRQETLTTTAIVTGYVQDKITSSNTAVLEIVNHNNIMKARGKSTGSVSIKLDNSNTSPVTVTVSNTAADIEDISFNIHTSLDPYEFIIPSDQPYTSTASVLITKDLNRINTKATVVADAVLSNGRNYRLLTDTGLSLYSEDEEVIIVTPGSSEITVKGSGEGLYLRGNWSNPQSCGGNQLHSKQELISIDIRVINALETDTDVTKLAIQPYSNYLSIPSSTSVTTNLVYTDNSKSIVTTDYRTTYTDTNNLLTYANGEISTVNELDNESLTDTVMTATYDGDFTDTVVIEIVSITELSLEAYPYPDYNGAVAIGDLSRIGDSDVYEQSKMKLIATLNNRDTVDLSDNSYVSLYSCRR